MLEVDYFIMNKYQSLEENLLYDAKVLYGLLQENKPKHIDELFTEFAKQQGVVLSVNIERVLFLALTFLYSIGLITYNSSMIKRV
ncbi:ABC-three component system middle component 6 [Geobacillus thermodenitrificans]|uniref:ABC-three component system middle component 6 n=1 Tax=Geobacillus thermodenitrificans TaxID=33940 RepID=UPI001E2B92C1|nr:ABC-three component system middle component 6 [Geobacillus thermodenitrificans]